METVTQWRTSTRSQKEGQCVEIGFGRSRIAVRDAKNRTAGCFHVLPERWRSFVHRVKRGTFDF